MKSIRLSSIPITGTELGLRGQTYVLTGTQSYQRTDGQKTEVLHWKSQCSECGQPFLVTSSLVICYLNRRCPQHHRPGRAAPIPGNQHRKEANRGS